MQAPGSSQSRSMLVTSRLNGQSSHGRSGSGPNERIGKTAD
ncbi:hypothetical protein R2601_03398 [Salipiger bermudensis HTCC2601]|uniref:Uncharacterized protein n=1 Tax=Salipiger bermudensis (strain DSM 26914 / JCM 13377 / KCTC 12554 / HTCC2601) TaxID=314265 RepID=Q0FWG6_SALBH|nr:hypothetical protein R2601_03398 [Salipiger bermudensis HTCC2601]